MKRFLSVLLLLIVVFSTCHAEGLDYSSLSTEELHQIINSARNELTVRELNAAENTVLLDQNDVKVYLTGKYEIWGDKADDYMYLDLEVVVVNDSDYLLSVIVDSACVNGWEVYTSGISDTSPGKKQRGSLEFKISDGEAYTYEEVEEIEMNILLYDSEEWETIAELDTITLHINNH